MYIFLPPSPPSCAQIHTECFIGTSLTDAQSQGSSSACTTSCAGDNSEICGGPWANSVYTLPPKFQYIGCYADGVNSVRAVPTDVTSGTGSPMTVELCASLAQANNGATVFGVQNGNRE